MIHHVEPQPGAGGRAATVVALIALAVVLGAIGWEIYRVVAPPPGPPPAPTTFSGSFGSGTATCPGSHTAVRGSSCTIPITPTHGDIHAVLRWDSNDPLTLSLVDPAGKPITAPVSGSNGNAGLVLDVGNLPGGSYGIRITDNTGIGPIDFTVGTA